MPSIQFIFRTLEMIGQTFRVDEMFTQGTGQYRLKGMVCYYGAHYIAFFN